MGRLKTSMKRRTWLVLKEDKSLWSSLMASLPEAVVSSHVYKTKKNKAAVKYTLKG